MPRPHRPLPPLAELKQMLSYDPKSGLFRWKVPIGIKIKAGSIAGGTAVNVRYRMISYKNKLYPAHRLAWLFVYEEDPGKLQVDHINGERLDNRIANLRLANPSQQSQNTKRYSSNTSGYKGVSWSSTSKSWRGAVAANGVRRIKYGFATPEAADAWACAMRELLHAEFANHGVHAAASATVSQHPPTIHTCVRLIG